MFKQGVRTTSEPTHSCANQAASVNLDVKHACQDHLVTTIVVHDSFNSLAASVGSSALTWWQSGCISGYIYIYTKYIQSQSSSTPLSCPSMAGPAWACEASSKGSMTQHAVMHEIGKLKPFNAQLLIVPVRYLTLTHPLISTSPHTYPFHSSHSQNLQQRSCNIPANLGVSQRYWKVSCTYTWQNQASQKKNKKGGACIWVLEASTVWESKNEGLQAAHCSMS